MWKTLFLWAGIGALSTAGCGIQADYAPSEARRRVAAARAERRIVPWMSLKGEAKTPEAPPPAEETPHLAAMRPRKVVYTGRFEIAVADPARAVAQTKSFAERMGGYMQKMTRESIVIRVPAEKFDQAVAALEKIGVVFARDIGAQDVTERYVDLQIRLDNAKALLKKLLELLEKARTVKEAMEVEKEIARVRTEVEGLTGKLNRLKSQVAFATITALFQTVAEAPEELKVSLPFWWLGSLGLESLTRFEGAAGMPE